MPHVSDQFVLFIDVQQAFKILSAIFSTTLSEYCPCFTYLLLVQKLIKTTTEIWRSLWNFVI